MHRLRLRFLDALCDRAVEGRCEPSANSIGRGPASCRRLAGILLLSYRAFMSHVESLCSFPRGASREYLYPSPVRAWTLLLLVFVAVHVAALFSPSLWMMPTLPMLAPPSHMALSGDWVTLKVDGIRYLEKPPLPYWLAAVDYHLFGYNVFATHLPLTLGVLGLAILAWAWGRRAYGERAAFYAALSILTSIGVFLFTRIFIPEVLLTLLLAFALYNFLIGLEDEKPYRFYLAWAALALAMLAKGLVAPVFFLPGRCALPVAHRRLAALA